MRVALCRTSWHALSHTPSTLLLALVVAGCGSVAPAAQPTPYVPPTPAPTATPWPADWDSLVCDVLAQMATTSGHLGAISDAADAFDLDTLGTETKAMAAEMKTANDDLTALPAWAPGATLVTHLKAAVLHLRKGANLLQLGITDIDGDAVKAGLKEIDKASPELDASTKALGPLGDRYGLSC